MRSIGLDSTIKDIKERASKQCGKGNNRSDDASDEDCEDDVDSEVDESCDVQEEDFVDMRSAVKKHSAAVIDLSADKNNDEEEEDLKPFLYLKGTMHYDSDEPDGTDQGVFMCELVTVEDFKDDAEVVVRRCPCVIGFSS